MKHITLDYILQLRNFILEKTEEIEHYQRVVAAIRAGYKHMTKAELETAVADVRWMEEQIQKHKEWCADAQVVINDFYKPATDTRLIA
jgi:hypothetical protein